MKNKKIKEIIMKMPSYYAGDPRRKPEYNDSQLVQEDKSCMSNLSEKFIHKEFEPGKKFDFEDLF